MLLQSFGPFIDWTEHRKFDKSVKPRDEVEFLRNGSMQNKSRKMYMTPFNFCRNDDDYEYSVNDNDNNYDKANQ